MTPDRFSNFAILENFHNRFFRNYESWKAESLFKHGQWWMYPVYPNRSQRSITLGVLSHGSFSKNENAFCSITCSCQAKKCLRVCTNSHLAHVQGLIQTFALHWYILQYSMILVADSICTVWSGPSLSSHSPKAHFRLGLAHLLPLLEQVFDIHKILNLKKDYQILLSSSIQIFPFILWHGYTCIILSLQIHGQCLLPYQ